MKLLDFGIAKILRDTGDAKGTRTIATSRFVTPGYGAPELLCGGAITTATDVYSLGVTLRELLSGKQPVSPPPSAELTGRAPPKHGNLPEAIEYYTRALDIQERVAGPDALVTLETLANLGIAYRYQGDYLEAERLLGQVIERMTLLERDRHPDMVDFLDQLGAVQDGLGKVRAAERLRRQSFELSREFWGESHPGTRIEMNNYAMAAHALGNYVEAEALMRKVLAYDIEQYGPEHPYVAIGRDNLGRILVERGRVDDALAQFEISAALHEASSALRTLAVHQVRHASAHLAAGNATAARQLVDRGLMTERQRTPPSSVRLATALMTSAFVRTSLGFTAEAETLFDEALAMIEDRANPHHPDAGIALFGLGELYLKEGRIAKARAALEQASKVWATSLPEGHWRRAETKVVLGACEIRDGNVEQGRQLMDEGIAQLSRDRGKTH